MNLVQINERLKDLPMQVIQQYANGMNPEVPPYLALGELQRREIAQKQMATAQGAQQGPQPSVKEQVEQKAGLMAAQAMQQQQAQQQMAEQRVSGPVPAGVPQPQDQPEAQPTMMAARGGLARAPVNFNFQHGGIVAFATGDPVKDPRRERKEGESFADFRKRMFELDLQLQRERNATEDSGRESERQRRLAERGNEVIPPSPFLERAPLPTPAAPASRPASVSEAQATAKAGPQAAVKPPAPIADLKALAEQKQRQQGPRPAASAPQAAPVSQESELSRLAMEAMRNPAKAMTPEQALAQEGKMAAGYGLDKPFGEEERGLLAAMKQRQAQYAAGRPSAELNATLRGFGQGYGGASAAGERARGETFNADMAHQREMLNAINAINKTNLDTGKERYKTSGNLFGEDQKSTAAANRERAQSLGQMSTAEANRKTQERGQDMQLQAAKIQAAASREAREMGADNKTIAAAEAAFARDPEAKALSKALEMLANNPTSPRYQTTLQKLQAIQASKYQQFGIKLEGAPSAQSPSGTRPPLSSFQR